MRRLEHWWLAAMIAAGAVACGGTNPSVDGGSDVQGDMTPPTDVPRDVPPQDVPGTDTPPPTDTPTDTMMMGNICSAANVIDLNMRGMRMGTRTTFTGTTTTGNAANEIPSEAGCVFDGYESVRQVAHSYRVQTTGLLRVTTDNAGTPGGMGGHDTAVLVLDTCDTRGANTLACNDDIGGGNLHSTAVTTMTVTAGTTVTIVVGTVVRMGGTSPGAAYELSVEELQPLNAGDPCDPTSAPDLCTMGNTCIAPSGFAAVGRCTANGTAPLTRCRELGMAMRCDAGMVCETVDGEDFCFRSANAGDPCNLRETSCQGSSRCIPNSPADIYNGVCFANGAQGGICIDDMTMPIACTTGLTCSDPMNGGTCRAATAAMAMCDPLNIRTVCDAGSSCAPSGANFACAANGTAAGTACRDSMPRCDGALVCSTMTGAGVCQNQLAMGATTCNAHFGADRCPMGQVCASTNYATARCVAPTTEPTAANDTPATAGTPITLPAAITGSIMPGTDVDCYAVVVPANGAIFAETNNGAGGCTGDTILTIHNPMGTQIDGNDDALGLGVCSRIDGTLPGSASRNLAAGTYAVCVRTFRSAALASYTLNIAVTP